MPSKSYAKLFHAALFSLALTAPAPAQDKPVQRYGEVDKDKSPGEIESDRRTEDAYKRALGNVPTGKPNSDPWGSVRGDSTPKPAPKAGAAKATRSPSQAN